MNSRDSKNTNNCTDMDLEVDESSAEGCNENPEHCKAPEKIQNGSTPDQYKLNNNMHGDNTFSMSSMGACASSSKSSKLSNAKAHEEAEMRNNVDYVCGIKKCPPKVPSPCPEGSLNNISGCIGSTSQGTCGFLRPNINGNRDLAGPSGLQLRERRDSSSGNEGDLSDAEEYCIYTYKGNNNDAGGPENGLNQDRLNQEQRLQYVAGQEPLSGRSSPEMDYLEMDFDPGPSCEQDTGDSDLASINEDIQNIALDNAEANDSVFLNDLSGGKVVSKQNTSAPPILPPRDNNVTCEGEPSAHGSNSQCSGGAIPKQPGSAQSSNNQSSGIRRTTTPLVGFSSRDSYSYHNTSGDLISPGESRDADCEIWADAAASTIPIPENSPFNSRKINLSSTLYHRMMAKKLMLNKQTAFNQSGESNLENELCNEGSEACGPVGRAMLWSEQEATVKQVTQIAMSACGATSAVNVLLALDVPFSLEVLIKSVATRRREPGTPLPRYLVSRSQAGATHKDIIRGLEMATNGAVVAKFFAFYPERAVSLSHWLHYWISKGAVPIATLNLQKCGTAKKIPDAWHHQMIFGVSSAGIYFTNPLECLPEPLVYHQLSSPSVLLIRRADVLAHWNPATDLKPLARMDHRWRRMNVLGQVVNMIRESVDHRRPQGNQSSCQTHIGIPASYTSGITLVMRSEAAAAHELLNAEELPLL